ncbi:hypothetical protein [Cysteiniphilum marinum]|uniref:hypothetical protein n=1 Tax=Cysteiniphilum marinum TaxID=2774191 RepID=UPI00193B355E|nr:hypothetical protein [Cysteiniphilum marinum]
MAKLSRKHKEQFKKSQAQAEYVHWNIYAENQPLATVGGLTLQPWVQETLPAKEEKMNVSVTFSNGVQRVLRLPQEIYQIRPIILQEKPTIAMYGRLDRATGKCAYVVAVKRTKDKTSTSSIIASSIFSFHVFSLFGKLNRIAVKPLGRFSGSVAQDVAHELKPRNLFQRPNYAEDQAIIDSWGEEYALKLKQQYSIFAIVIALLGVAVSIGFLLLVGNIPLLLPFLFLFCLFYLLHRRYEAKTRKRFKASHYFWKLITLRGI